VSRRAPVRKAARGDSRGDSARYRRAAEAALQQVDFCAEYLRSIQKKRLAAQLAKNSLYIRRNLMGERGRSSR
jgi:hypothetical protein